MKTSTLVNGDRQEITGPKKIEITHYLGSERGKFYAINGSSLEGERELVLLRHRGTCIDGVSYDIFMAIHKTGIVSSIYLGHWNDGII